MSTFDRYACKCIDFLYKSVVIDPYADSNLLHDLFIAWPHKEERF